MFQKKFNKILPNEEDVELTTHKKKDIYLEKKDKKLLMNEDQHLKINV